LCWFGDRQTVRGILTAARANGTFARHATQTFVTPWLRIFSALDMRFDSRQQAAADGADMARCFKAANGRHRQRTTTCLTALFTLRAFWRGSTALHLLSRLAMPAARITSQTCVAASRRLRLLPPLFGAA